MVMPEKTKSLLSPPDLAAYQGQETVFIASNLVIIAVLLCLHAVFASYWGRPAPTLILAVGIAFTLKTAQLIWVKRQKQTPSRAKLLSVTWGSIVVNVALALLLSELTDREDSPYFVLLIFPIIESAFRLRLPCVLAVAGVCDFLIFFWTWGHFRRHPPLDIGEYYEVGITSLIFGVVALLVWWLVNEARSKSSRLAHNLQELQRTREKLLQEEKLAAVGRLSSAIAHEIRNPVAMISSSLATAKQLSGSEREEMFEIAAEEAQRLVGLTTDFLAYARPRAPQLTTNSVSDTVLYVVDACRAHAGQKGVRLQAKVPETLMAETDSGQLQQALINLVMNAIDAAPRDGTVEVRARSESGQIWIDVENGGEPLESPTASRIFEPFFTTKPKGSGLGLGIARNIARAHGGDLVLRTNGPERICFSLTLPMIKAAAKAAN